MWCSCLVPISKSSENAVTALKLIRESVSDSCPTEPSLAQVHGRARLVVLACEVGGRWSGESLPFLHLVAEAKVRDEPEEFRDLVEKAWMTRSSLLACTAARALALSLLERRCAPGCDGCAPSTSEVVRDHRHALHSRVGCACMVLSFVTLLHPGFPPRKNTGTTNGFEFGFLIAKVAGMLTNEVEVKSMLAAVDAEDSKEEATHHGALCAEASNFAKHTLHALTLLLCTSAWRHNEPNLASDNPPLVVEQICAQCKHLQGCFFPQCENSCQTRLTARAQIDLRHQ